LEGANGLSGVASGIGRTLAFFIESSFACWTSWLVSYLWRAPPVAECSLPDRRGVPEYPENESTINGISNAEQKVMPTHHRLCLGWSSALVALPSLSQQEDSLHQEDSHIRMGLQTRGIVADLWLKIWPSFLDSFPSCPFLQEDLGYCLSLFVWEAYQQFCTSPVGVVAWSKEMRRK
jgi:hypothetical protein